MINVTLTGNVFDENENLIDCYYDVYYKRQNILVTGLRTELNQYNFNIGSVEHLTQNGDLKENDIILIRFNTLKDTLDNSSKFSSIAVIYLNESTIVKDVQLKEVQTPVCIFDLKSATLNNTVYLNVNKSLDNSWLFKNNTMYQRENLYSYNIFPNLYVKDENILYDFDGFWTKNNWFSYNEYGFKDILYSINLPNSLLLECKTTIQVFKNQPTISYSIPQSIKLHDEVEINVEVIDIDKTILSIKHYFDNNLINETDLRYSYNQIVNKKQHTYKTEIIWNNGFEDILLIKDGFINIQNQEPEVSPEIEYINSSKNNLKIKPNAVDPEDDLDYVRYKIYIRKETVFEQTNDIDYTWVLLDILESNILDMSAYIDFYKSGNFKIEVQAFDKGGLSSDIKELFVDIECKTSGKDQCTGYFDWSKTTSMLKFKIEENDLKFKIEENNLKFKIEENDLKFKIEENDLKFKINEESNLKFTLNCSK